MSSVWSCGSRLPLTSKCRISYQHLAVKLDFIWCQELEVLHICWEEEILASGLNSSHRNRIVQMFSRPYDHYVCVYFESVEQGFMVCVGQLIEVSQWSDRFLRKTSVVLGRESAEPPAEPSHLQLKKLILTYSTCFLCKLLCNPPPAPPRCSALT